MFKTREGHLIFTKGIKSIKKVKLFFGFMHGVIISKDFIVIKYKDRTKLRLKVKPENFKWTIKKLKKYKRNK